MAYQSERPLFVQGDRVRHRNGGRGRVVRVTTVYVYDVVWDENMIPREGTHKERDLSAETPTRTSVANGRQQAARASY
jgi:hypothetical protein